MNPVEPLNVDAGLKDAVPERIRHVLIVGAGTMGREIAWQCARHAVRVSLYDVAPAVLEQARAHFQQATQSLGSAQQAQDVLAQIETGADLHAAAQADLVVECVPENLELKRRVFTQVSEHCRPKTILATNTSSLIPSQMASACQHPERLAALHFHLPVATSNLVDLMPHPGTAPSVLASLEAFARRIGQVPIRYDREHHGYIFNSIFGAMQRQALDLVIDGVATVENVDRSWMGIFHMAVGPFGMFDGIGLDTIAEILSHWAETLNDDTGRRRVNFLRRWTGQGFLGVKTGRGFYTYPDPAYARPGFVAAGGG